VIFIWTNYE